MTELELSLTLGILADPESNRIPQQHLFDKQFGDTWAALLLMNDQKITLKIPAQELWAEFLPWHSMN